MLPSTKDDSQARPRVEQDGETIGPQWTSSGCGDFIFSTPTKAGREMVERPCATLHNRKIVAVAVEDVVYAEVALLCLL